MLNCCGWLFFSADAKLLPEIGSTSSSFSCSRIHDDPISPSGSQQALRPVTAVDPLNHDSRSDKDDSANAAFNALAEAVPLPSTPSAPRARKKGKSPEVISNATVSAATHASATCKPAESEREEKVV